MNGTGDRAEGVETCRCCQIKIIKWGEYKLKKKFWNT